MNTHKNNEQHTMIYMLYIFAKLAASYTTLSGALLPSPVKHMYAHRER